jgi:ribosomal protein L37AE/L43A
LEPASQNITKDVQSKGFEGDRLSDSVDTKGYDTHQFHCNACNAKTSHIGKEGMWECTKCGPESIDLLAKKMAGLTWTAKAQKGVAQVGSAIVQTLPSKEQIASGATTIGQGVATIGRKIYEQLPSTEQIKAGASKVSEQLPSTETVKSYIPGMGAKTTTTQQTMTNQEQPKQDVAHTQTWMQQAREVVPGTKTHALKTGLEQSLEKGTKGSVGGTLDLESREAEADKLDVSSSPKTDPLLNKQVNDFSASKQVNQEPAMMETSELT